MPAAEARYLLANENSGGSCLSSCFIRDLALAKLCYLFLYAFIGSIVPYLTIYFYSLGLTVSEAGFISGLRTILPCFLGPLFGMLADRTGRTKLIWQILVVLKVIGFFIAPWLLSPFALQQNEEANTEGGHWSPRPNITFTNGTHNTKSGEEQFHYTLFFVVLTWGSLMASFGYPGRAFLDKSVIALVKKHEPKSSYGLQRIFAPIGFTVSSLLSGVAIDLYAKNAFITKYNVIFYCSFPFGILHFIFITLLPNKTRKKEGKKGESFFKKEVIKIFKNVEFDWFLVTVIVLGIGFTVVNGGFLFFLLEEINTPKSVVGIIVGVASFTEVMIYPYASKIRKLIGGHYPCFIAAVFSFSLRLLLLSFIKNYWLAIPIQLLHSIGYGLFWVAAIEYTNKVAPASVVATVFNIVVQLYSCFANFIANIGGGILYQHLGGRLLFQVIAAVCGIWGIILALYYIKHSFSLGSKDHDHRKYKVIT